MEFKVGDKVVATKEAINYWKCSINYWWEDYTYIKDIKKHIFVVKMDLKNDIFITECGRVLSKRSFEHALKQTKEQQIINKIQWLYKNSKCELEKKWVKE